ncbi:MAG: hypothetical protein HY812_09520 [Planctomycetes bacterium]|nr:hypothetical protein [Planctomycetota bacterium]
MPWHLQRAEARFLATALRQAMVVARSCQMAADPDAFLSPGAGAFLVRSALQQGGDARWADEHVRPGPPPPEPDLPPIDRVRLQRILKDCERAPAAWEFDLFHASAIIDDGERRPYFAILTLTVDHGEGFVVHSQVSEPPCDGGLMREQFLAAMQAAHAIPAKVLVRNARVRDAILPIASMLKIKAEECPFLEALETVKALLDAAMACEGE